MNISRKLIFALCAAVIIAAAAFIIIYMSGKSGEVSEAEEEQDGTAVQSQAIDNTVEWDGKSYEYNSDLTNILFMGVDKSDMLDTTYMPGDAGQADCIILLSCDSGTGEAAMLQINRNTMTQIDIYSVSGNKLNEIEGQICLQYAYSIGGESSCWATKKTVQELLFGLEIDAYIALDISGVPEINDALGGVDVYMEEDYTYIDESFVEGETVHLEGELAQRFVQYRDTTEFNSVQGRMERQVAYVSALIASMGGRSGTELYSVISPFLDTYILTDLTAEEMVSLTDYEYLTDDVQYLPGEMVQGEVYEEFYVDDDELQELIFDMFYEEVS